VSDLTNGTAYKFGVVSVDEHANPSTISATVCATPEKTIDFQDIYEDAGGSGGGKFCFVATAVFGSADHPAVAALRQFRDGFVRGVPGGELAIRGYYAVGPTLAAAVADSPTVGAGVERLLFLLAGLGLLLLSIGPGWVVAGLGASASIGLAAGIALPRARRRR
jgi:hypothetical protein